MRIKPVVLTVGVSPMLAARLRRTADGQEGYSLHETHSADDAVNALSAINPSVVLIASELEGGSAISVADYVAYRHPGARVIFEMLEKTGFADGSLFAHASNAHAMLTRGMRDDDVDAVVAHHSDTTRMTG